MELVVPLVIIVGLVWLVGRASVSYGPPGTLWVCADSTCQMMLTSTNKAHLRAARRETEAAGWIMAPIVKASDLLRYTGNHFLTNMAEHMHYRVAFCAPYVSRRIGPHVCMSIMVEDETELDARKRAAGWVFIPMSAPVEAPERREGIPCGGRAEHGG